MGCSAIQRLKEILHVPLMNVCLYLKVFVSYSLVGILRHHGRRVCGRGGLLVHHVSVRRCHQRGGSQAVHRRPRRGARRGSVSLETQIIITSTFFAAVPTNHISCAFVLQSVLLHPSVVDCAVVGLEDALKGHVPLALCVLRNGEEWSKAFCVKWLNHKEEYTLLDVFLCVCLFVDCQKSEEALANEMVKLVRDTIGPVAAFRKVVFVKALPKTRSGKIPRSSLANLVNDKPYKVLLTW